MKRALIALAIVSAPAFANSRADLAKVDRALKTCIAKDNSNVGMKMCTGDALEAADHVLQRSYDGIVKSLKAPADDEYSKQYNVETLRRLVAAERAWITFRDAECDLQGTTMLGGSGESLEIVGCLYDQTVKRVTDLEKLFER